MYLLALFCFQINFICFRYILNNILTLTVEMSYFSLKFFTKLIKNYHYFVLFILHIIFNVLWMIFCYKFRPVFLLRESTNLWMKKNWTQVQLHIMMMKVLLFVFCLKQWFIFSHYFPQMFTDSDSEVLVRVETRTFWVFGQYFEWL